ncbi:MAG: hypothetical protein IKJ25_06485 [Clostridia bacterium]|nr:hypothetical protein [Clostridia bacterium]
MKKTAFSNNYTKWVIFAIILLFLVSAVIVLVNVIEHSSNISKELESFSINNLTSEDIVEKEVSSIFAVSRKYDSNTKTGVDGASKYEDTDHINFKCKRITGINRISATKVKDCTLTLNISSTLSSGNAKIVVICDNEILEYVEFGQDKALTYTVSGEHIYSVKILCEEAELEIDVTREIK